MLLYDFFSFHDIHTNRWLCPRLWVCFFLNIFRFTKNLAVSLVKICTVMFTTVERVSFKYEEPEQVRERCLVPIFVFHYRVEVSCVAWLRDFPSTSLNSRLKKKGVWHEFFFFPLFLRYVIYNLREAVRNADATDYAGPICREFVTPFSDSHSLFSPPRTLILFFFPFPTEGNNRKMLPPFRRRCCLVFSDSTHDYCFFFFFLGSSFIHSSSSYILLSFPFYTWLPCKGGRDLRWVFGIVPDCVDKRDPIYSYTVEQLREEKKNFLAVFFCVFPFFFLLFFRQAAVNVLHTFFWLGNFLNEVGV